MSEVLDQTSEKVVDQVPEKKQWKKSSMRKWGGLAILISALVFLAGVPFSVVFWVDVVLLVIAEIYGRVTGKMEVPIALSYEERNAGLAGHDICGNLDLRPRD